MMPPMYTKPLSTKTVFPRKQKIDAITANPNWTRKPYCNMNADAESNLPYERKDKSAKKPGERILNPDRVKIIL